MRSLVLYAVLAVVTVITVLATAPGAQAAAATGDTGIAVIDMDKVVSGYEAFKKANDEFSRYFADTQRQIELNRQMRLLDEKEVKELQDLLAMVALNPEQKTRLTELQSLSSAREDELGSLGRKTTLTPEETARRTTLTELATKRAPVVAAKERELTQMREKRNQELAAPFNTAIEAALAKIAKQNKIGVIFRKDVAVWAAVDLTDQVMAELNKK